jgi:outer membrane protein assembly factor BamB
MKANSRFILCGLLMLLSVTLVQGQTKLAAAWTAKFTSPIMWQRVHSLGYLLVCTSNGLYCINPGDGSILWENNSFAGLDPSRLNEVAGTEFVTISYKVDANSTIPLESIIEITGGAVLFDSKKESIGVLSRHVLAKSGRLLVMGVKQGGELKDLVATIFMYDIQSGKQLWMNDQLFKPDAPAQKGFLGQLQALGQQLGGLQKLTSEPFEIDDQHVIITHPSYVIKLKSATGEPVWKSAVKPSLKANVILSPYRPGVVFVGTEVESESGSGFSSGSQTSGPTKFYYNEYYALDNVTGNSLWKQPAREEDHLNQVIMHEKGLIVCPLSSQKPTINLIDYQTGSTMWGKKGKGIKAEGSVVSYIPTKSGILLTTAFDNAWNNKAEEYYLNVLDPNTGAFRYEKSVKLKGDLVSSELVPKGLLFATTREVNILDVNAGTLVWPKSIESGGSISGDKIKPFPVAHRGELLYIYSPREAGVFEVDKNKGTSRVLTSGKIEFEGKEMPSFIDVFDDGLVLSSEQNVMKVGVDGSLKYQRYYPAPREPALVRALYAAQAVRAAYIGAAAYTYSAAFAQASAQTTDATGKAVGQELSKGFSELGDAGFNYSSRAMKQFSARYKASQSTPNFTMMITRQEKKGNQLIQVSKHTGEIERSIDIKNDKEPEYDMDEIINHVYYRPSAAEIVCYKL